MNIVKRFRRLFRSPESPPLEVPPRIEIQLDTDWSNAINIDWFNCQGMYVFRSCLSTPYILRTAEFNLVKGNTNARAFLRSWLPNATIDATVRVVEGEEG